ncbi:Golgi-associated plant pathogenesis-related protein 1-like isoform X3 [Choloepus didactylus]|uniref:Golgi-associated plant pathogenesis-related protein 1-like isoform X3 n=1 Tax=Choloepus didactylus TaxID=27675 RepID=UPI00189CCB49|nr:Golgi-associated plant pathogenesis-related protein 1-like isoform X3 [Choloepus didactylus]
MGKSASKQFNIEVLKAHNEYRWQHGVPPLKLCKKLNQEAQQDWTLHSHGVEEYKEDGHGKGICQ